MEDQIVTIVAAVVAAGLAWIGKKIAGYVGLRFKAEQIRALKDGLQEAIEETEALSKAGVLAAKKYDKTIDAAKRWLEDKTPKQAAKIMDKLGVPSASDIQKRAERAILRVVGAWW